MEHSYHFVDLVDKTGKPIGRKRRRDIDKRHDLYHTVHTLLITPLGEIVCSKIPQRSDLPNLYADKLGTTAATIRRSDETAQQATTRSVARELCIDQPSLYHLGDKFYDTRSDVPVYLSLFYFIGNPPITYSHTDSDGFVILTPTALRRQLLDNPNDFAPSFLNLWKAYKHALPL